MGKLAGSFKTNPTEILLANSNWILAKSESFLIRSLEF